jgi:hypothetical protein
MVFIYILELNEGKYYIGKTDNPDIRITNHFKHTGSEWTKLYPPVRVIDVIPNCDTYDEDKYTKIYMQKYGIDNVRGGSFCMINLSPEIRKFIQQGIDSSSDNCYRCHNPGHFTSECSIITKKTLEIVKSTTEEFVVCVHCSKSISSDNYSKHLAEYCDQLPIYNKNKSLLKNIKIIGGRILKNTLEPKCNNCGHHGHLSQSCYAKRVVPEKYTNIW